MDLIGGFNCQVAVLCIERLIFLRCYPIAHFGCDNQSPCFFRLVRENIQSAPVNVVIDQYNFLFSLPDYLHQKARGIEHLAAGKDICIQLGILGFKSFNPGYQFRLCAVYTVDDIHEIKVVLLGY